MAKAFLESGFFAATALFLLFSLWVSIALMSGTFPMALVQSLFRSTQNTDPFIPVSFYTENDFGIRGILPGDNSLASVNANGRRIVRKSIIRPISGKVTRGL